MAISIQAKIDFIGDLLIPFIGRYRAQFVHGLGERSIIQRFKAVDLEPF